MDILTNWRLGRLRFDLFNQNKIKPRYMTIIERQLDRIRRALWYALAMAFRTIVPIKKGRIICWSFYNKQYSCNPMYITGYILEHNLSMFELVWAFNSNVDVSKLDKRIVVVNTHTFKYLYYLYSSQFVITNSRNDRFGNYFHKKHGQKYIQTWHGSTPIKMIEKDAEVELGHVYVRGAKTDSKMCDLMLSNSKWFSNLIKSSFWYDGEILENGIPRNDIFFDKEKIQSIKDSIYSQYNISSDAKIILYAPTFRSDNDPSYFELDWGTIIPELEKKFNSKVVIFLRLHPNSLGNVGISTLLSRGDVINLCYYPDMQELLCVMNILITDYSSTMFESILLDKICFLYANDYSSYNRKFYFDLKELPFSFSKTEEELIENIRIFNEDDYRKETKAYSENILNVYDNGLASQNVVNWMVNEMK